VTAGKRAGARFEQQVVDYLIGHGFPYAERRVMGGTRDRGDIAGVIGWTLEAKSEQRLDLAGAIGEAAVEAAHAETRWYATILKRRRRPIGDAYVVLPLHLFADLLREDQP
jgi:hypothetical protein